NRNGARDVGEPGVANWEIIIDDYTCQVSYRVVTDVDGDYCALVCAGTIFVREAEKPGWIQTQPAAAGYNLVVIQGEVLGGIDFGNFATSSCPPADLNIILGTGVDDGGIPIAPQRTDPAPWLVLSDSISSNFDPHQPAVVPPALNWATQPGAEWVSTSYNAGVIGAPNGVYVYQACFCLDSRFNNPNLVLSVLSDNQADVFLNGGLIGSTPENSLFGPPTLITVSDYFQFRIGMNCIRVEVTNTSGPTAINIAGQVVATSGECCNSDLECQIPCPPCATVTSEPMCADEYVDTTNGGCAPPHVGFTDINCDEVVCGSAGTFTRAGQPTRDEDWYRIFLEDPCSLTWRVTSEFAVDIEIRSANFGCPGTVVASATGGPCGEAVASLPAATPGFYLLVVRPHAASDVACDSKYIAGAFCCRDCDQAVTYDQMGNIVLPPDFDPSQQIIAESGEEDRGFVEDLYPQFNTSVDTWYPCYPCQPSLGEEPGQTVDWEQALVDEGISAPPDEIVAALEQWEEQIAAQFGSEPDALLTAPPVSDSYSPRGPHCTRAGCKYVFGGRDIVFVHGLRLTPLRHEILGTDPRAADTWNPPATFPGRGANPEYYDNRPYGGVYGYWKEGADRYWQQHIDRFLKRRGIMNRYLIVCFPSTDRLEVGIQAILTQIGDAMRDGLGVVDPAIHPDAPTNTVISDFGTPSFVIVSHSTGGLISSAAMSAAANNTSLNAQHIAAHCKGHVAFHAVFSGSRQATAAIAVVAPFSMGILGPTPWACDWLKKTLFGTENGMETEDCTLFNINPGVVLRSNLVDLVPTITQLKWHRYLRTSPVRTLTVVSGHPSYMYPFKYILHPGFDDGVSSMNSQVASPNFTLFWPSLLKIDSFRRFGPFIIPNLPLSSWYPLFDRGVAEFYPLRAALLWTEQVFDRWSSGKMGLLLAPFHAASAATPYVSVTGMLEPKVEFFAPEPGGLLGLIPAVRDQFDPLRRLANHFSYIQSTAGHFDATPSYDDSPPFPHFPNYRESFGASNREETRVITDQAVYQPYAMPHAPLDGQPLLTDACTPKLKETVKYNRWRIPRRFGRPPLYLYIWKRTYHQLESFGGKHEANYIYDSVLCETVNPCQAPEVDCNENGIDDICEVRDGFDCNANGFPDSCDIASGTSLDTDGNGRPDECDPPPCPGDVNGDQFVNLTDLSILLANFGDVGSPSTGDLNGDGDVNLTDLSFLLARFGTGC
ncbi:MAG: dockerin type I domain-containing protein, partial [Phycisphaerae bacterium]